MTPKEAKKHLRKIKKKGLKFDLRVTNTECTECAKEFVESLGLCIKGRSRLYFVEDETPHKTTDKVVQLFLDEAEGIWLDGPYGLCADCSPQSERTLEKIVLQ